MIEIKTDKKTGFRKVRWPDEFLDGNEITDQLLAVIFGYGIGIDETISPAPSARRTTTHVLGLRKGPTLKGRSGLSERGD